MSRLSGLLAIAGIAIAAPALAEVSVRVTPLQGSIVSPFQNERVRGFNFAPEAGTALPQLESPNIGTVLYENLPTSLGGTSTESFAFYDWVAPTAAWGDDLESLPPAALITQIRYAYVNTGSLTSTHAIRIFDMPGGTHPPTATIPAPPPLASIPVMAPGGGAFVVTVTGLAVPVPGSGLWVSLAESGPGSPGNFWLSGGSPGVGSSHLGLLYNPPGLYYFYGFAGLGGYLSTDPPIKANIGLSLLGRALAAAPLGTCADFEGGVLPSFAYAETTSSGGANGRVQVTTAFPYTGTYAVDIDTDCTGCGGFTQQAVVLVFDLAGVVDAVLDLWVHEHGDENHAEDGIFISDDGGATWALIQSLNNFPPSYQQVTIDLDAAATGAGMSLVDGFLIKLQSFDNFSIPTDGYSFDDVCVHEPIAADVAIAKDDGTTTAVPGTNTVYSIVASNAGPSDAPAAQVTDTFPAACTSVNWTCAGAGGGSCPANGSGNLNATVNLPVGGSVTFSATCAISSAATGTLVNTANVSPGAGVTDNNPANNTATDTDTLVPTADVAIVKDDGTTTAVPGTNTVYSIVASNGGPSNAPAAQVIDIFPAACTSVTWTCSGAGGGSCPANGSGNLAATVNLPVGGSVTFTATCAISPAATGTLTNTANVAPGAGVTDLNGANNSATDIDTLTPTADVTVAKTVEPAAVDVGDPVTYTIVVGNLGPSDATGVTVTDLFPIECQANLAWTCTPAGGATCTPAGVGDIVDVVNLPVGSTATYVATCNAYSATDTEVVNTASGAVPAGTIDPDPGNSSSSATLAINAFAIQEIPTLGRTGLVALLVLIGFAGLFLLRRTH